jgi:hypothetical protein
VTVDMLNNAFALFHEGVLNGIVREAVRLGNGRIGQIRRQLGRILDGW